MTQRGSASEKKIWQITSCEQQRLGKWSYSFSWAVQKFDFSLWAKRRNRYSHADVKWLHKEVQKLFTMGKPPTCHEDEWGLLVPFVPVLLTNRGQCGHSMDADHINRSISVLHLFHLWNCVALTIQVGDHGISAFRTGRGKNVFYFIYLFIVFLNTMCLYPQPTLSLT